MNKNLIRLTGGFVVLLGLAFAGHQVFVQPGAASQAASAGPAAAPEPAASAYVVYPDRVTEQEFKLDYATFNGKMVQDVTVTPLPPHLPGAAMLRVVPGTAKAIDVALNEKRCGSPVHIVFYRINEKTALARAALDAATPTLSIPFADGKIPAGLLEIKMDDKAENNYWCGVTVRWTR